MLIPIGNWIVFNYNCCAIQYIYIVVPEVN